MCHCSDQRPLQEAGRRHRHLHLEQAWLSTSIANVQTQVLDQKGRFDSLTYTIGGNAPPPASTPVHKLRFPKYDDADDPLDWLHKAEQFFHSHAMPDDHKVWTAFYMQGMDSQWYYRLEKNRGEPSWTDFDVNKRFGPPIRSNTLGELTFLRRTGSMDEYQDQFLKLLACCDDISEKQQISFFMASLLEPLSTDVQLEKSETLDDAMALVPAYERRDQVVDESALTSLRAPCSTPRGGANSLLARQAPNNSGAHGLYLSNA